MNRDLRRAWRAGAWVALALGVLSGCNAAPTGNSTAAVVEDVRVATTRSGVQQSVVTLPSGERMLRMSARSGFSTHVLVAKPGPDGKPSVSCVDSPARAEAFLTGGTQGTGQ
jgi:hypothetical protein